MPHVLAKDLRNAVLQAAVQGKLTEHLTTDCDINEYYSLVKSEKKNVTRKEKELIPTGEEPFDIPEYWMWTFLDELVAKEIRRGKSPKYAKTGNAMAFAQKCNSKYTGIRLDLALCLDDDSLSRYSDVDAMTDKDIVINSTGGGTLGRVGLFEERFNIEHKKYFPDSHVTVVRSKKCVNPIYLLRCLQFLSPYIETLGEGSTNQTELKPDTVRGLYIPLPPIEEQERIVKKVDELMTKIDEYEKIEKELTELQKAFPGNMKDAILQAAMQGKLTEQLESDGDVYEYLDNVASLKASLIKERKLKKDKTTAIVEDEYPFDIPGNWAWTKLGAIANLRPGKTPPRAEPAWWGDKNDVPWVSIADMIADGHVLKTKEFISQAGFEEKFKGDISPAGTMIMSFKLTVGRVSYLDIDALHNEAIISIFPFVDENNILQSYLFKVLPYLTEYGDSKNAIKGTTLNADSLCNLYIPLPPLEEQQRIVDKLDQLLPLCEQLEKMST